jgi:hypothetical protein
MHVRIRCALTFLVSFWCCLNINNAEKLAGTAKGCIQGKLVYTLYDAVLNANELKSLYG